KMLRQMEQNRVQITQLNHDLQRFVKAYQEKNNAARVAEIKIQLQRLRGMQAQLPSEDSKVGGYYLDFQRYLKGGVKHYSKYLKEIEQALTKYAKEVQPSGPAPRPSKPTGQGRSGPANFEVYILSVSGDVEFYVNEVKVTRAKQSIPLNGKREFKLYAV